MYTEYDRMYGNFPEQYRIYIVYTFVCMVLANPSYSPFSNLVVLKLLSCQGTLWCLNCSAVRGPSATYLNFQLWIAKSIKDRQGGR